MIIYNDSENSDKEIENLVIQANKLNNRLGFNNKNNSCSFDSFLTSFINSIYPLLLNIDSNINKEDLLKINDNFSLYIKFIKYIINKNISEKIYFYDLYDIFNKENKCDLFNLYESERDKFVPFTINLRNLYNNDFFCIKYNIKHYCTGSCKFSKNLIESLYSSPFIDIPLELIAIKILIILKTFSKIIFILI